jgi:hypothetical protein
LAHVDPAKGISKDEGPFPNIGNGVRTLLAVEYGEIVRDFGQDARLVAGP